MRQAVLFAFTCLIIGFPPQSLSQTTKRSTSLKAIVKKIVVRDNDGHFPGATVHIGDAKGGWSSLGRTSKSGEIHSQRHCERVLKLRAFPDVPEAYQQIAEEDFPCAPEVVIQLRRVRYAASPGQVVVRRIAVSDELGRPIEVDVETIDGAGRKVKVGKYQGASRYPGVGQLVLVTGEPRVDVSCSPNSRIRVTPREADKFVSSYAELGCRSDLNFVFVRRDVSNLLIRYAEDAYKKKNFAKAAMLYSESATRVSNIDPELSTKLEILVFEAIDKYFPDIPTVYTYDPGQQNRPVLTREAADAISEFQKRNGVVGAKYGQLEYRTLSRMAGAEIFPYIRHAYREADRAGDGR